MTTEPKVKILRKGPVGYTATEEHTDAWLYSDITVEVKP